MTSESASAEVESNVSADLVARIERGERGAETELYRRYARGLVYLLKRRCGNLAAAEDFCHEALLVALPKLRAGELKEASSLAAFLRSIAVNLLIADQRKQSRRGTSADSEAIDSAIDESSGPCEALTTRQLQWAVRKVLDELPTWRDRDVLISVYLRDEDRDSICQRLELDAAHFNRVLSRAKKRFGELLERRKSIGIVNI